MNKTASLTLAMTLCALLLSGCGLHIRPSLGLSGINYENAEKYTYEDEMTLYVNEVTMMDEQMMFDEMTADEELESEGPNKILVIVIIVVCIIIIAAVVIILVKKHRKKKEDEELVNLLDDLEEDSEGKDDNNEIS